MASMKIPLTLFSAKFDLDLDLTKLTSWSWPHEVDLKVDLTKLTSLTKLVWPLGRSSLEENSPQVAKLPNRMKLTWRDYFPFSPSRQVAEPVQTGLPKNAVENVVKMRDENAWIGQKIGRRKWQKKD